MQHFASLLRAWPNVAARELVRVGRQTGGSVLRRRRRIQRRRQLVAGYFHNWHPRKVWFVSCKSSEISALRPEDVPVDFAAVRLCRCDLPPVPTKFRRSHPGHTPASTRFGLRNNLQLISLASQTPLRTAVGLGARLMSSAS